MRTRGFTRPARGPSPALANVASSGQRHQNSKAFSRWLTRADEAEGRAARPVSRWAPGASRREAGVGWGLGRRGHFYFLLPEARVTSGPGRGKGVSERRGRSIWGCGHLGAKGWRWAPAQAAGPVGAWRTEEVIDCVCLQGWLPADTELLHRLN